MNKKIMILSFGLIAFVIAGVGLYKTDDAYEYLSLDDMALIENSLAISESHPGLKFIAKHVVYKVTHTHKYYVYDETGKKKIGEYVNVKIETAWWQTCDNTSDERFQTDCYNDVCTTEACAVANGWMTKKPDVTEGDVFISY